VIADREVSFFVYAHRTCITQATEGEQHAVIYASCGSGGVWALNGHWRFARDIASTPKFLLRAASESGRPDLNRGPPVPQTGALTRLRHAP
jgi:hypothetical protein